MLIIKLPYSTYAIQGILVANVAADGVSRICRKYHNATFTNNIGRMADQTFLRVIWMNGVVLAQGENWSVLEAADYTDTAKKILIYKVA